jgi:hypothetical protein
VQSALILAIILIGAVGQAASIRQIIRERLFFRHVAFFALMALTLSRAIVALVSRGHLHPYLEFWKATRWPLTLLGAAAAIEAFWRLAMHFRNVRGFGFILLGVIAGVAAAVAWIVAAMNSKWDGPLRGPFMFEECVELALMLVTMFSVAFFRLVPAIPVRPNSIRHLLVLSSLFGSSFAGTFIGLVSRGQGWFAANLTITAGMAVSYWWWALRINRSGEVLPFPIPPMASLGEIEALNELDRRLYAEGNALLDDLDNSP